MASEKQLVAVMTSRQRLWSPRELCDELGIHVCDLVRLIRKARSAGIHVGHESGTLTGSSSKYWLVEGKG
ncbi:hypothetical protein VA249_29770 [Vibrio alfacsensis]|uniref:hypothetical protein n=1 Tax=Vibrio alfacsensis TaxID=1074311 RepID=UPI001BF0C963|nr:hypothetical protein [Vibrio alfacsensis]BBM66331.1 hypothetical protein VA249_29770 [Vibrio alfacsensis]